MFSSDRQFGGRVTEHQVSSPSELKGCESERILALQIKLAASVKIIQGCLKSGKFEYLVFCTYHD